MSDSFDPLEPLNVWKQQATDGLTMTARVIRKRALHSKARARRQDNVRKGAAILGLLCWSIGMILVDDSPYDAWFKVIAVVAYAVLLIQMPGMAAEHASRKLLITLDLTSTPVPCVDYYRKQLEVRRDSVPHGSAALLYVVLLGVAALKFLGPNRSIAVPIGLALVVIGAAWYWHMRREIPRIQMEIDELEAFTRSSNI